MRKAVKRLETSLSATEGPKLKHYFLPAINIMAGINEDQRLLVLRKLREFLENPQAALSKIADSAVCIVQKKVNHSSFAPVAVIKL